MTWPPEGFVVPGPLARKIACAICGERGYSGGKWMDRHRRPHLPCPWCGRLFAVKLDGTGRIHTRCPKRPDEIPGASGAPDNPTRRTA